MYFNYMNNGLGLRSFIINIFGNIIVFIPLGYFYKSLSKRKISFIKVFEFALIIPLFVEIIQYISLTGSFDIDDIILNATGILIGFLSGRRLIK
jgi:glycopeptide antibiotics resistance protein